MRLVSMLTKMAQVTSFVNVTVPVALPDPPSASEVGE